MKLHRARQIASGKLVDFSGQEIKEKDYEKLAAIQIPFAEHLIRVANKRHRQNVRIARRKSLVWRKRKKK